MGRTLYCDCCGQDIRDGNQFYMVDKIPRYNSAKLDYFNRDYQFNKYSTNPYIICADCFQAIGHRVQEMNNPVDIDFVVDKEK